MARVSTRRWGPVDRFRPLTSGDISGDGEVQHVEQDSWGRETRAHLGALQL